MDRVRVRASDWVRDRGRVRVRDKDRRSEPNLWRPLAMADPNRC